MVYITHIRLSAGGTTLKHITDLYWHNPQTGESGASPRANMVDWIDRGGDARVKDQQGEVKVEVVRDQPPYLRTVANGRTTDNLLSLPRF
ncbi:DUF3892 domain-containing protein [Melittangium boletus]|uniref:DUF3892 domain-containing protein n=1 Tax=Melittangium boletus DSM 14713 TaxID=1294270 RepID=A0A250ITG1_9BACT|nr:DUF3892 domain-containing protein [Melittangium boletus]ATB34441.1 hypothetical protein MEBOL_007944 [Melittangium boletus DSM 14713]